MSAASAEKMPIINFNDIEQAFAHKSNIELYRSFFIFKLINSPWLVNVGTKLTGLALQWRLPITPFIKYTIYEQFCGGETLQQSLTVINKLGNYNVNTILDYGVEAKETDADFQHTVEEVLRCIAFAAQNDKVVAISCKITGFARFKLLQKVHDQCSLTAAQTREWDLVQKRMESICAAAAKAKVSLYFDAEESWIQDAIDGLIMQMMEKYNSKFPTVFNTIQLYRHDRLAYLKKIHQHASENGYILAVKPVRGAYMEKERQRAAQKGYPSPIQANKQATDKDYNKALEYCVSNIENIVFCNATHNEESTRQLCQLMQQYNVEVSHPHVYFAQLYGMGDYLSFNLSNKNYNVAKYLPYGKVRDVVPYLIRRSQENTSVAGQSSRELTLIEQEIKRRNRK